MRNEDIQAVLDSHLLRALVDNVSAMLAYWDSSLHCRLANRAYLRWFGIAPEAMIGQHISAILGPELYRLNLPYMEGALRGEAQEFEREIPNPEGGPPRQGLANYIPDVVDGTVRGFFVLVTDITEIKQTELALRESEERFRLTIDEAPIGMALVARDGRFIRVNRALCDLVGYSAEELMGLTFQAITHPDDLDKDLTLAAQLDRGEIPRYRLEKRYIHKDGTIVDVMLSGSAVRGVDGVPKYFVAQIEDISEQKRIEYEQTFLAQVGPVLASSLDYEETLTRIAELSVRDLADFCIVDVVEEDHEVRRLKVVSKDPSKAWICEYLQDIPLDRRRPYLLWSVMENQQPVLIEHLSPQTLASFAQGEEHHRVLRATGMRSLMAVPLLTPTGLLGAIALVSSRAARAYGPADLRLAEELARRAALSIENARLYRAARRAAQARDDVLGIVAHDLRNPLNSIVMQAALLRRRDAEPERRSQKPAELIERAARRMNRLIQDLLDVTRMEAGRLSVEAGRIPALLVLADCVEAQAALATSASVELGLDVAQELPELWADRDRLLQVLENLVGNAIKFSAPGARITIGAAATDGEVLFWVADAAGGIPTEDVPHLFDRFWQGSRAERRGAGLGLAIAKGVVEAHGGRIWAQSTPGEGTTFFFTIPAAPRAEIQAPQPVQHGSP